MNKKFLFLVLSFVGIFSAGLVQAQPVCPLCVVAVGAGLGFSRWLGVDDVLSSIWIGALLMALVLWTYYWFVKKNWNFKFSSIVIFLAYYLFTYIPLYYVGIIGHTYHKTWGVDKVILGSAIGTVMFIFAIWLNGFLKSKNNGKVYFPYQRVVIPFVVLVLTNILLYFII